jgi:hypothetical protein
VVAPESAAPAFSGIFYPVEHAVLISPLPQSKKRPGFLLENPGLVELNVCLSTFFQFLNLNLQDADRVLNGRTTAGTA